MLRPSVLVLGGSSDIAAAIVAALPEQSTGTVVALCREPERVFAVPGRHVVARRWNATEVSEHAATIGGLFDEFGPFGVVICAVGLLGHHAGIEMGPDAIDHMVRTNFGGPAAALAVVADRLRGQADTSGEAATIVVLSSVAGVRPRRSNYVYGSSKAGLDAFARGLGDALVDTGVRVLVVRPGFVRSKMTSGLSPAPFACDPQRVARSVVRAVRRSRTETVWVPAVLGPLMAVMANVPRVVWRRIAADR